MAINFRSFTRRLILFVNIAVVIFFLLACLVPFLNPQSWWYISFLGLAFPFLLLLVFLFMIGWLILLKPRLAAVSAIALLLGIKSISVFFAFNSPRAFNYKKEPGTIRVVSWNVARFIELKKNTNNGSGKRLKMLELIKQQDADVLCLQEFHSANDKRPDFYDNITPIQKELGYPYFYFTYDTDGDNLYYSSIIFSRFPIVDSGMIRYPRPTLSDALLHADIKVNDDTIRFYTTHLQSYQFGKRDYEKMGKIKSGEDSMMSNSRNILSKLKKGTTFRSIQADLINKMLGDSPHPIIFCADLNDVPNSYTYSTVKKDMQDAFLKKGFGIGRTFTAIAPTLRIDYIFADDQFRIKQFNRLVKNLSDHYMLVADLEIKK